MSDPYTKNADVYIEQYEKVSPISVHRDWSHLLPATKSLILDIGAGSGRDAGWLANLGHEVLAVEPSKILREKASLLHPSPSIQWIGDSLPALKEVYQTGLKFDLILLSAVWIHVPPSERERAFRKLTNLLKPGGKLVISLRYGPVPSDGRVMYRVSSTELRHFANRHLLDVILETKSPDEMGRPEVTWALIVLQLPDDGTGALPLLRHVIINDAKSSSYKLALLRTIIRIADGAQGMVLDRDRNFVTLPFGIVALYWLKMFKALVLDYKLPQQPAGSGSLGFVKDAFLSLQDVSPYDLRIGARFEGDIARNLIVAMRDARNAIRTMPAVYTTYPGKGDPVFICESKNIRPANSVKLDREFFEKFGTIKIPVHVWDSLSRYACWVEPAVINEWCLLMAGYDSRSGIKKQFDEYLGGLRWLDERRDTNEIRNIVEQLRSHSKAIFCVWTGRRLTDSFDVDHCLPFCYWPNNDLWNLMPSNRQANNSKSNKIPSAKLLETAQERILAWWDLAYNSEKYSERFIAEASAALPTLRNISGDFNHKVYQGIQSQRVRLKVDQQLTEWEGL